MSAQKPLVQDSGQIEQLQGGADLDIPLEDRVQRLQRNFVALVEFLDNNGLELPLDLLEEAQQMKIL